MHAVRPKKSLPQQVEEPGPANPGSAEKMPLKQSHLGRQVVRRVADAHLAHLLRSGRHERFSEATSRR